MSDMHNWIAKEEYPDLSAAKLLAVDCETKDPELMTKGPGTFRKDGYICGFSVATDDGFKGYYPVRHEGGGNVSNPENAKKWLKDQMQSRDHMTGNRLDELGGPSRKTIKKILSGKRVRRRLLQRLAEGLSEEEPHVSVSDVPTD